MRFSQGKFEWFGSIFSV